MGFSEPSTPTDVPNAPVFACIIGASEDDKPLRTIFLELLLRLGADPNAVDAAEGSLVDAARAHEFDEAVELVEEWRGAAEPSEGKQYISRGHITS